MRRGKIATFKRGWFIGNFEPSVLKTEAFEVGLLSHHKGEYWAPHYHKEATEYNVLISGKMAIHFDDGYVEQINAGDVFIFEKGEVSRPEFLEDCKVLVVKVPSIIGDKYDI